MALLALGGRGGEIDLDEFYPHIGWLMAVDTSGRLVRPHQRERGLRMVEARKFLPRFSRVASLATGGRSIRAKLLHAFVELSLVWILMAACAGKILPVIEHNRLRCTFRVVLLFMAISAGNGNVPTS